MKKKPLILVTNDDGVNAKGLQSLIEVVQPFGDIVVVAPSESRSAMSNAITVKIPLHLKQISSLNGLTKVACSGTPVDCVKLALNQVLERKPDLLVSGINHGSNSSISVVYSGTMGAAIEGCINRIPSIGFSLLDFNPNADFSVALKFAPQIVQNVLEKGLPEYTCLNVNFPQTKVENVKGMKICRQTKGMWKEEFEKRVDPHNREYYWLTGNFKNYEPEAEDTDEWALNHNYISVVPVNVDLTSYNAIQILKLWQYEGQNK
ncbi:MAG: 5'/3'-nucleotidase SurE [Chlorobi bacterium]|nr:5'/3'-nucleotidase SurE [Chlorobiota bacterium]